MPSETNEFPQTEAFWNSFQQESESLYKLVFAGKAYPAYQRVGELLCQANYPHVYEVTSDASCACLIFTPESDSKIASIVDAFVDRAPAIPNWKFFNRRQRRPVSDAIAMLEEVYGVDASDMLFSIQESTDGFDVAMYTQLSHILGEPEKEGFFLFFLEHAVGEKCAMEWIRKKTILPQTAMQTSLSPRDFVEKILHEIEARQNKTC